MSKKAKASSYIFKNYTHICAISDMLLDEQEPLLPVNKGTLQAKTKEGKNQGKKTS